MRRALFILLWFRYFYFHFIGGESLLLSSVKTTTQQRIAQKARSQALQSPWSTMTSLGARPAQRVEVEWYRPHEPISDVVHFQLWRLSDSKALGDEERNPSLLGKRRSLPKLSQQKGGTKEGYHLLVLCLETRKSGLLLHFSLSSPRQSKTKTEKKVSVFCSLLFCSFLVLGTEN